MARLGENMKLAMFKDSNGLPRAWGQSVNREKAIERAKAELELYTQGNSVDSQQFPFALTVIDLPDEKGGHSGPEYGWLMLEPDKDVNA